MHDFNILLFNSFMLLLLLLLLTSTLLLFTFGLPFTGSSGNEANATPRHAVLFTPTGSRPSAVPSVVAANFSACRALTPVLPLSALYVPFLRCHWGVSAAAIFAPETPREKRSDSETEAIVSPMLTSSSRSRLVHKISAKWCREEGTAKCSCRFGGQPRFLEKAASETVRPVLLLSLCFFLFFLFFCFFVFCFLFLFSIFLFFGSPR